MTSPRTAAERPSESSPGQPAQQTRSDSGSLGETIRTVIYAVLIALVVRTLAFEPFNIPSGSMIPTLLVGDYLFVSKFSYGYSRHTLAFGFPVFNGRIFSSPVERGDVAVFKLPPDNKLDYIKRIVGLPGDRIQMKRGVLHINDEAVKLKRVRTVRELTDFEGRKIGSVEEWEETLPNGRVHVIYKMSFLDDPDNTRGDQNNTGVFVVTPRHYFGMGDNRDNSSDSRVFGLIPEENLVGRAEMLFFSLDRGTQFWQFWNWPWDIRYDRLLQPVT